MSFETRSAKSADERESKRRKLDFNISLSYNDNKDDNKDEKDSKISSEDDNISDTDTNIEDDFLDLEEIEEKLKETDPVTHKSFMEMKEIMNNTEPNIMKYLKEPLLTENRARLISLYEIYKSIPKMSEDWLIMRDRLISTFDKYKREYNQYNKFTEEQHKNMNEEATKLELEETDVFYKYKILTLNTSQSNKAIIYRKFLEMEDMSPDNEDYGKLKSWVKCATSLPHDMMKPYPFASMSQLTIFLQNVKEQLDNELYGMKNVKEQILLYINSKIIAPGMKKCSLGLIGPPGVGKTAISRLLSRVLDYPFEQISFGGVSDASFIKGHEYTYIGAQPGAIVKALQRMKYKNGILYLDEYEKISDNKDICAALLHITDPEQNCEFRDSYMSEITIDLSHLWLIYSMNSLPDDSALRDRIFVIEVNGYNLSDKIKIVCNYILPKALKNIGRNEGDIIISENVASFLINRVCSSFDKGMRTIDKTINDLCNKINFLVTHNNDLASFNLSFNLKYSISYPVTITTDMIVSMISSKETDISIKMMYM
jgi:ATP-dependent Lon protease